ncbi:MAG: hypothetical protein AAGE43_05915 [Pseudomonadota bacterium]
MGRALVLRRVLLLGLLIAASSTAEEPKVAYWLHCAGCHLLDGSGAPPEVPTLIAEPGIIAALPGGREYLIRIPGVAQAGMDNARLAGVLNYMLEAFSPEELNQFTPFSAEEVGRHRDRVLKDPLKARARLLAGHQLEAQAD